MIGAVVVAVAVTVAAGPPPKPPLKNPRVSCGCPTARVLQRGPAILDGEHTVSAWLHDDAQLELFQQDAVEKQKLTPVDGAPIDVKSFVESPSTSRFVKVSSTGALPERAYLGIMRKTDTMPRDAVAALASPPPPAPPPPPLTNANGTPATPTSMTPPPATTAVTTAGPPIVKALWLAPLEARERPGCGEWVTHRIAFELADGSPAPEAFIVEDAHTGKTEVVDARYVGVFGLGRVDICDQGLAFDAGKPTHLSVKPVSASFGVGDAWKFDSDGTGQTDTVRTGSPATANRARIEDPFPVPGMDDHKGPTLKMLAMAVMSTVVGGAAITALVAWVIIPMRRRRMAEIRCPSCQKLVPYDALNPKTDGFFCPSCGAAGFWKGRKGEAVEGKQL